MRLHRLVLPVPFPGAVCGGYRAGGHLAPDHQIGWTTFEQFLAERAGARSDTKVLPRT